MSLEPGWDLIPDMTVVVFANAREIEFNEELLRRIELANLVISLGNTDLDRLATVLPSDKAAVAVLGGDDISRSVPAPFKLLHGNGFSYRDWRIAGVSGAHASDFGNGFKLSEDDANQLCSSLPQCDILITHAPPTRSAWGKDSGFAAFDSYIDRCAPIYHFCCSERSIPQNDGEIIGETLVIGVNGSYAPEPLPFG